MKKGASLFVFEEGKKYEIPYHLIKKAVFSNLRKEDLIDVQHSARLQYRLMCLDTVIKAIVDFNELKITVIYNPADADNNGAKMDIEWLIEFLEKEGVGTHHGSIKNEDFDYYGQFYSCAFFPQPIRKSAPYGYTLDEWKKMEKSFIEKSAASRKSKSAKFKVWQDEYQKEKMTSEAQSKKKRSMLSDIFGIDKA